MRRELRAHLYRQILKTPISKHGLLYQTGCSPKLFTLARKGWPERGSGHAMARVGTSK
jgi:hypothetical protein